MAFAVSISERDGRWIVHASEDHSTRFVGWYLTLSEAEARRESEFARIGGKQNRVELPATLMAPAADLPLSHIDPNTVVSIEATKTVERLQRVLVNAKEHPTKAGRRGRVR
jgi:hypothetical protein